MNDDHHLALYGITGALGREIQSALEVDHEGIAALTPVAGVRSAGQTVRWRGDTIPVVTVAEVVASDIDFAIFATPREVTSREASRLLDAGARVLDASGVLASSPLPKALAAPAPVVWPQLSSFAKVDFETATALVLPSAAASTLAALLDAVTLTAPVEALTATILLPASQAGREGIDALSRQTVGLLNYQPALPPRPFPAVLAFNAVAPPTDDVVLFESNTAAELKALVPALGDATIELMPIWIAAFSGIVVSLHLRFAQDVDGAAITQVLAAHPDLREEAQTPEVDVDLDEEEVSEEEAAASSADDPAALSLRSVLDTDRIHVGTPLFGKRSARLVLMADPIHRTAQAASTLLARWMATLDA